MHCCRLARRGFVFALVVFYPGPGSNGQQPPSLPSPQMQKDAPYHTGGEYKPESTVAKTPIVPVAADNAYPAVPLAKIEILPAAITISGSHYDQRLVVEGTYTDGHQEDLTAQATFAIPTRKSRASPMILPSPRATGRGLSLRECSATARAFPCGSKISTAPAGWSFRNDVQPVLTKMDDWDPVMAPRQGRTASS